jgi:hypothetical protein
MNGHFCGFFLHLFVPDQNEVFTQRVHFVIGVGRGQFIFGRGGGGKFDVFPMRRRCVKFIQGIGTRGRLIQPTKNINFGFDAGGTVAEQITRPFPVRGDAGPFQGVPQTQREHGCGAKGGGKWEEEKVESKVGGRKVERKVDKDMH